MPPDAVEPGSPRAWMRYARADLELSRIALPPGTMYEQLCFHAQQAVEKSLKAVLVSCNIDFPPTHNIQGLIDLLPPEIIRTQILIEAASLTVYAAALRYPGDYEPVSEKEYMEAIRLAEMVVSWSEKLIG